MANETSTKATEMPLKAQLLKLAVEVGPLAVFFIVNARAGIFWGTGVFMGATVASLIASRILFGRIPVMPLVSGVCVAIFGGLTLWLQDDHFIKMKPTIVNALFAGALFIGLLAGQSLLRIVFGEVFRLTDEGWRKLTLRWALFVPRRAERDHVALVLDRHMGELQGVRRPAVDDGICGRSSRSTAPLRTACGVTAVASRIVVTQMLSTRNNPR